MDYNIILWLDQTFDFIRVLRYNIFIQGDIMPNMPELLKQIQRDLACPICGRKYELSQIKVRGAFEQILIIQTTCMEGHLTLFMTVFHENDKVDKKSFKAITSNEVLDISNKLNNFHGDFEKLWAKNCQKDKNGNS